MTKLVPLLVTAVAAHPGLAQTSGVPGLNDYALNDQGAGTTSCATVVVPAGPVVLTFTIDGVPGDLVAMAAGACVPGLAPIPSGATIDIDLSGGIVFDGTVNAFPFPIAVNSAGLWQLAIATDLPPAAAFITQCGVIGPTHPGGVTVTQALRAATPVPPASLLPSTIGGDLAGLSDDGSVPVLLSTPFTFYGTAYSAVFVNMNGSATFGVGSAAPAATAAAMLAGPPRLAPAWDDWNPGGPGGGTVRVSDDGAVFACEWFDVPHAGAGCAAVDGNTFALRLDLATGDALFLYGPMGLCQGGVLPSTAQVVGLGPGGGLSPPHNVDLWSGTTVLNAGPTMASAVYESFTDGVFGPFDLGPTFGANAGIAILANGGAGPYAVVSF